MACRERGSEPGLACAGEASDDDEAAATFGQLKRQFAVERHGLGGSLGDRYGRRRIFVTGVVWFATASLLCGLAPGAGVLIAARALQGIGGALLTPGSLALIQASFHPDDRGRAVGLWSGFGGIGAAIGPFLGGSKPFVEGLEFVVLQVLLFLGLGGVGILLGYLVVVAFGKDHKSRSLKRYEQNYRARPHRTVRG